MTEVGVSVISRTEDATRDKYERPPRYRVVMYNDNYTTMEFVIHVLVTVFHKDYPTAESLMWTIHRAGQAVVGVYPRELAESRCDKAMMLARKAGYPLLCAVEPERE
ncbi:MAG TPA: ATP-dependent Clp protease adaptor ClpS [Candidatus Hydrogenedentes bacterium]|nr:ATP-dependent Clp protease adaptor ClpS [Candidatus Hydrogenedentota bacterium]HOV60168.1 ATP-dependent Clp protease adaptor ClpS [Candidatus Hydrogenedentota bacterium]